MMISLFVLAAVLAVGALFLAGMKSETEQGGEDMMIKKVYVYLVLFATLMMSIGGCVAAFMAITDIVVPAPYYQSFEEYKQGNIKSEFNNENINLEKLSEDELMARYQAMAAGEVERQASRAKNSLIKSLGWIIIPLPVFVLFQRRLASQEGL